jgi:23S rRNA pseudouridine1911/1915/1917 synthase
MSEAQYHNFTPLEEEFGNRVDKYLDSKLPELSRRRIQTLIKEGGLTFNGKKLTNCAEKTKAGKYNFIIPPAKKTEIEARDIPIDIVYEDAHLIVINKQAGLTVHPGAGNYDFTLVNALLKHYGSNLSSIGGVERPGIVHRLDKNTSGLMVVAKDDFSHVNLSNQLQDRSMKRTYTAFCWKVPKPFEGRIKTNIGRSRSDRKKMTVKVEQGKEAITNYKVIEVYGDMQASKVECKLQTGRTHQIRVHMSHIGAGVIGDPDYGRAKQLKCLPTEIQNYINTLQGQALHARKIEFQHPKTEETLTFKADLPDDLLKLEKYLRGL